MSIPKKIQLNNFPIWLITWVFLLSLCWLMPVTSPPWSTLPSDAWAALVTLLAGLFVVARVSGRVDWHCITGWVAAMVVLPWLQLWLGILPYAGQAWISSIYLLGLLIAMLVGASWERTSPLQLADALFMAIGFASVMSVGLQLYAWLGLSESGGLGVLFSGLDSVRPAGNLGQPNQLATLLLWGLLACLWAYLRKSLSGASATFVSIFLLIGLALTQSRTGLLGACLLVAAVWLWRSLWPNKNLSWVVTGLYLLFLALPIPLQSLNEVLLLGQDGSYFRLEAPSGLRLRAWGLFLQAALERPWLGYGWTETNAAQMAVAGDFPGLGSIFSHSHNLFIDFVLWTGLPLGLLTAAVLLGWFWVRLRAAKTAEDATLLMLLGAVGVHAMLEFPLQYAYFLLPTGLVIGVLNTRLAVPVIWTSPRWSLAGLWLAAALTTGVTLRDYVQVDASYTLLRLEQSPIGLGRPPMGGPPDVWVLTHLRDWIKLARTKPRADMSPQDLVEMEAAVSAYPSLSSAYGLAKALALNGQPDKARAWLAKICKFTETRDCLLAQRSWEKEAVDDPRTLAIPWPG